MATSTATKILCRRWRAPVEPRPLSLRISIRFTREPLSAGARPKTIAANSESASVKSSTRPSREISSTRGNVPGKVLSAALAPQKANRSPSVPPTPASKTLSVRSWRTTRTWPAPSAARTANSRERPMERASRRFATFGTGNQQQETDGGEQHQQERLDVADDIFLHGNQRDADVLVGHREGGGQIARDHVHVGLGLRQRNARFQPAERMRAHRDAAIAKRRIVPLADGSVDVAVMAVESEAGRDHAHDSVGRAVQGQRFSDDIGRRAEFALPQSPAQNHDRRRAHLIVIGAESAAENGLHAEGGKEVRGNHVTAQAFCFGRAGDVVVLVAVDGHAMRRSECRAASRGSSDRRPGHGRIRASLHKRSQAARSADTATG